MHQLQSKQKRRFKVMVETNKAPVVKLVSRKTAKSLLSDYGIVLVLLLFCVTLTIASPYFLTSKNIINVLRQVSVNGLISIGMTFVILTGGIDLSVGSTLAFSGVFGASFASTALRVSPLPAAVCILLAVLSGLVFGAVTGMLIAKWDLAPFIITLGTMSVARGLTYIYTDGMPIPQLDQSFLFIGKGYFLGLPMPVVVFALVFIVAWVALNKTRYGRYIYAIGGSEKSARISGINTKVVLFSAYAISGVLSALGGVILTARTTAGLPQAGTAYEMDAIAAVVIGGTSLSGGQGSLFGTLIGVLIMGVMNNGLDLLGVSSYYQQVFKGLIIIAAVMIDSFRKASDK
jgi:ribose/xylose/arabinose/galactoside ABC-type transport system permease subunit